ncbi:MAG: HEAT repeat domain-containing protein [Planctomycetota bacterium]
MKALKGYRLYLPNNQILVGFVTAFCEQLSGFVQRHGEVCLRVSQFQIGYRGARIYENKVKEESLAFRLFIHGVREITFHEGTPVSEVTDFLHVIHRAFDAKASVDDLLTLLWEKDLKYITFIILDDFFEEGEYGEFEEFVEDAQTADHTAASVQASVQPIMDRLLSAGPPPGAGGQLEDLLSLTEVERARLALWAEEEKSRDLVRDVCGLILEILEPNLIEEESRDLLKVLDQVFEALLNDGEISQAAHILAELKEFGGGQDEGPLRAIVQEALSRIGGDRIVAGVRPHIAEASIEQREELIAFLASLDESAVGSLVDLLDLPEAKTVAHEVLLRLGRDDVSPLLPRLSDPRPAVVTALVRLLGQLGDPLALAALEGPLFHVDPSVRTQTLHAIERIGTATALPLIGKVLDDPQQDIRIVAVRCIASLPPSQSREPLLAIARGKEFAKRSYFEKKEILLALGKVEDQEVEEYLLKILRKRPLFRRGEVDDLRACAVRALALRGTTRAMKEIRSRAEDRSPQVRRAVAQALRSSTQVRD